MIEKLCVFCEHWTFDPGHPDYSAMTAGDDASMECLKGHYKGRTSIPYSEREFREIIKQAETCLDYEQVK